MTPRLLIVFAAWFWSSASFADYAVTITNGSEETAKTCSVLGKALPKTFSEVRKLGKILAETTTPDAEYCDPDVKCSVHKVEFEGMNLQVLVEDKTKRVWPLIIDVSDPQWHLLGKTRVGQSIDALGQQYGEKFPIDKSPILLAQACTPMVIYQKNGTVYRLTLDCQACH
jgi:hypothetical protein